MSRFPILIFIAILLSACTDSTNNQAKEKAEFDTLFAKVMEIHDDVMPETNNLYKLKKIAQENTAVLPDTSSLVKELMNVQITSDQADDAMMEWMANFKVPESNHKSKIAYLKKEKEAITKVRELMLSTLYKGKNIINKSDAYIKKNKLREDLKTVISPSAY